MQLPFLFPDVLYADSNIIRNFCTVCLCSDVSIWN